MNGLTFTEQEDIDRAAPESLPPGPAAMPSDMDAFFAANPPNVPTSAGRMYISPTPIPNLSPEEQAALQHRLALATAGPSRAVMPPAGFGGGVELPDMQKIYQAAFTNLPVDKAAKAVDAALQYQGQRGYQADLAAGMSPAQAMAKWGPMLFRSSPAAQVAAVRAAQPAPSGPIQAVPIMGPDGKPTGQMAFRHGTSGVTVVKQGGEPDWVPPDETTGAPGYFKTPAGTMHIPPRDRGAGGGLTDRDILASLRAERKELADDPATKMEVTKKTTPAKAKEIEAKKARLEYVRKKIEEMIEGTAPKATTARTRAPTAIPLPKTKAEMVVGQPYRVKGQDYTWDGQRLVKM